MLLGTVPAQTELDALRETVYGAAGEAQVERISADLQSQYLLVIVHKGAYDAAASALREYGFTPASFDGASGTAEENIRLTDENKLLALGIKQRNAMIIIVSVSTIFILLNILLSLYLNVNWIVLGDILIWTLANIRLTKSIGQLQSEQKTNK